MTRRAPRDPAASARARLLNLARETGVSFDEILVRYGTERLLYRLGASPFRDRFLLKGATLFAAWTGARHRGTRDADLLGFGEFDAAGLRNIVEAIIVQPVAVPDGLSFDARKIAVEDIRDAAEYGGYRVKLQALLAGAEIHLQLDVAIGEVVVPGPVDVELPTLLDGPAARLRAYPVETVVAEKLEAMVRYGLANSRLKDYYDLWYILSRMPPDPSTVASAVSATFGRRGTALPDRTPSGLTDAFADEDRRRQWRAFLDRTAAEERPDLDDVLRFIRMKIMPIVEKALAHA